MIEFINECNEELLYDDRKEIVNARNYLTKDRGLNLNSIKKHKIGFCREDKYIPEKIKFFGTYNKEKRWDISNNVKGRIVLPIFSEFGDEIAFATKLPTNEKGYPWWNIPSPFKKGNHLFLLDKSRKYIFEKNKVYVVEGYVDALILYQHGVKNVVAIMGTAYTLRKIALTARYCNNICLCFDSDKNQSGEKAKKMSVAVMEKYSFYESISTIDSLPVDEDPASFVHKYGIGKMLEKERFLDEQEIYKICFQVNNSYKKRLIDAQ